MEQETLAKSKTNKINHTHIKKYKDFTSYVLTELEACAEGRYVATCEW